MPRPKTVDQALEQAGKSAANYRYFFEQLKFPTWLAPLAERGRFRKPPEKLAVEGGVVFPGWPESQYLARMARLPEAQAEVLRIVLAMQDTDNINVHNDLLDIACALPAREAAKLVGKARLWVQSAYLGLVKYHIADLIVHLANGEEIGPALQLAKDTFALQPITPPASDEEEDVLSLPEPQAWLDDWHYEESLKKALPVLVTRDAQHTLALFISLLRQAVERSRHHNDEMHEDYSYIWHDAIEHDEHPPRLRNTLISAVRNAAMQAIRATPANCEMVLAALRNEKWTVFKRLELHVLRAFPDLLLDDIKAIAPSLVDAFESSTRHEAALLLKETFAKLPPETQEAVLERTNAGPEEVEAVHAIEFFGEPATPERIEAYKREWRAARYSLIAPRVPEAWRERVNEVLASAGSVRRPDELNEKGGWIGPSSPKTAEDLGQMGPAQVIDYLRDWKPEPGPMTATPEGLGRILAGVIANKSAGYIALADRFQEVDPTFVRFFFSGVESAIKANEIVAWPPVLRLAAWVVAQPREIPGRHKRMMEADPDWSWTRGTIATLLEAGFQADQGGTELAHRELVWQILEPLTSDPDPTPEHEAKYGGNNMDPATMAINTVRGKAFHTLIQYALWVRRNIDQLASKPPLSFDVMPEVRRALEEHLEVEREPSLTIRSVYGRYFPWLQHLDRDWAQGAVPRIFPTDPAQERYFAAAWDSCVVFCQPYNNVLPVLRGMYAHAIAGLPRYEASRGRFHDSRERLGEHLTTYYWRGQISIDDPLLVDFFRIASDEVRAGLLAHLGQSLAEDTEAMEPAILDRLRALWEWRLYTAQAAQNLGEYRRELATFGWWFASNCFDDAWRLAQLQIVLDATRHIDPEFKVLETLESLAPRFALQTVLCVTRVVEGDRQGWETYGSRDHIQAVIKAALASDSIDARSAAARLVDYLVGRGNFEYRSLLS